MDHPFRSAVLGGFNKQDVLMFLEEQSKQSAQAQQKLRSRLEEAEGQRDAIHREADDLRNQLAEVQRERDAARQERDSLSAQLSKAQLDLSASRARAEETVQKLEQVVHERDEVQSRLDAARPDAQAYLELKERTAGVELEAHRRAQAIQEKAEGDACRLRQQVERWLAQVRQEYDALCSGVESTVAHAAKELDKAGGILDQLSRLMASQGEVFDGLDKAYGGVSCGQKKPPVSDDK